MTTTLDIIQIFILLITWISEIILCLTIIIIFTTEWRTKQQFRVSDKILMSMALTNLFLQSSTAIDNLVYLLWFYQVMSKAGSMLVFSLNISFLYANVWHTAWLSIHYCLKLVGPSHSVFSRLKRWMSASIVPLLVGTLIGALLINLPFIWTVRIEFCMNSTSMDSKKEWNVHQVIPFTIFSMFLGICLPFMVTLLQGHVRATTTMIIQLLLNLLLYLSVLAVLMSAFSIGIIFIYILWNSILLNPCAQTLTLILGNPRMKTRRIDCGLLAGVRIDPAVPDSTLRVVAYADDVTIFVPSQDEVQCGVSEVERYAEASGSKINQDKYVTGAFELVSKMTGRSAND
ncbi:taste receptor type 2 member 41-like [Dendropsophus ebraccatus]|uniref:taste receptor type 2 member 41-like n=1 Tax=Dendropsophus ebraccatus TaxID=150705 RepID=UPI00383196C3